jgi:DNA-binding IclR family transcriptional regulator
MKQVLKQVLKPSSYDKLLPLIECLDENKYISIQEVMNITGKSRTTAWRYLKMLVDADVVETDGETNNLIYRLKDSYIN